MFWLIYISASFLVSFLLAKKSKKYFTETFVVFFVMLVTPAQVDLLTDNYAPSVFVFIFNNLLEQEYSTRALRPILITLFFSIISLYLFRKAKKRFF